MALPQYITKALEDKEISQFTEIQQLVIPLLLQGKDVVASSKTGSGKTFAYAIPAVMNAHPDSESTKVLVVCPTRELAAQVTNEMRFLNRYREGCKTVPLFGGINMQRQITSLKKGAEIVVGTPGRILDHLKRRTLKLEELAMLVLDEADEMLKMGFKEEVEKIIKKCPRERITAMFSATMPDGVVRIAENYMTEPQIVRIDDETARSVTQYYVKTGLKDKCNVLIRLFGTLHPRHAILFCNTKRMVDKLHNALTSSGISASAIHGDMRQRDRKEALDKLKSGETQVLVATDVAARGLDVEGVDVVFNYDVPQTTEYYVHRVGRTGRADKTGKAFTLINTGWGMKCLNEIVEATHAQISEFTIENDKRRDGERKRDFPQYIKKAKSNCDSAGRQTRSDKFRKNSDGGKRYGGANGKKSKKPTNKRR